MGAKVPGGQLTEITVGLTPAQSEWVRAQAQKRGMTRQDLIRWLVERARHERT